ncbi:MAG: bacteriohemerythrin [Thermoplasmatota archaeon]
MVFQWKDEYSVGVEVIDDQHKELISRLDKLATAIQKQKGNERIEYLLDFMEKYTKFHFSSEEEYMEKYDYPGTQKHQEEHGKFIGVVEDLKSKFKEEGRNEEFAMAVQQFLIDWLILHIEGTDGKMGSYLKDKM